MPLYWQCCQLTKVLHDALPVRTLARQSCYLHGFLQSFGVKSPFTCTLFTFSCYQDSFQISSMKISKPLFSSLSLHPSPCMASWRGCFKWWWTASQTDIEEQTCEFFPNPHMVPYTEIAVDQVELTHIHRGRIINNAAVIVMNHDRWWQKLGDEYIQISVLGRYVKYYCVREKTFSTIMPIPQARDPELRLSVKFDFS